MPIQQPGPSSVATSTAGNEEDPLFLTDAFDSSVSKWETYFLQRLARCLHDLIISDFYESREQSIFYFFVEEDTNLNGHIDTEELTGFLNAVGVNKASDIQNLMKTMHLDDGARIDFVPLLKWYNNEIKNPTSPLQEDLRFRLSAAFSSMFGRFSARNSTFSSRLKNLDHTGVRRCIFGYRKIYRELRAHQTEKLLQDLPEKPKEEVLFLFGLLQGEFDSESETLFDLFLKEDTKLTGKLENVEKQKRLFQGFDSDATEAELDVYIREVNADDDGLKFLDLYDWWLQSKRVADSMVSQKGHHEKLTSTAQSFGIYQSHRAVSARISSQLGYTDAFTDAVMLLDHAGIQRVCGYLRQLFLDIRDYKTEHELTETEHRTLDVLDK